MDTNEPSQRTFPHLKYILTPTPPSPCLPEPQSNYSTTPDCNLITVPRGLMMTFAVMLRAIERDPFIQAQFPPALVQTLAQFSPLFREMAKHDNPAEAFHTGGFMSWCQSKWISWNLWWNQQDMIQQVLNMTHRHWDTIYQSATEDEKQWIFCIKSVAQRPLSSSALDLAD